MGYTFVNKTRKPHICEKCGRLIPKGKQAFKEDLVDLSKSFAGRKYTGYFHPVCHK